MFTPASLCQAFCEINAHFRNSNPWCPLLLTLLLPFPDLVLSRLWSWKPCVQHWREVKSDDFWWWPFLNRICFQFLDVRVVYDQGFTWINLRPLFLHSKIPTAPTSCPPQSILDYIYLRFDNIINLKLVEISLVLVFLWLNCSNTTLYLKTRTAWECHGVW